MALKRKLPLQQGLSGSTWKGPKPARETSVPPWLTSSVPVDSSDLGGPWSGGGRGRPRHRPGTPPRLRASSWGAGLEPVETQVLIRQQFHPFPRPPKAEPVEGFLEEGRRPEAVSPQQEITLHGQARGLNKQTLTHPQQPGAHKEHGQNASSAQGGGFPGGGAWGWPGIYFLSVVTLGCPSLLGSVWPGSQGLRRHRRP